MKDDEILEWYVSSPSDNWRYGRTNAGKWYYVYLHDTQLRMPCSSLERSLELGEIKVDEEFTRRMKTSIDEETLGRYEASASTGSDSIPIDSRDLEILIDHYRKYQALEKKVKALQEDLVKLELEVLEATPGESEW